jgi:hypothetical protein
MTYADPHRFFSFVRRFRPKGGSGTAQALVVPLGLSSFCLHFGFLGSREAKQGKGWRRFESRTLGAISVRLGGRGPQGNRGGEKKAGRIDPMSGKNASA